MDLMTIGAFAERSRLSPKALRLYDRLGLLPPARTDPVSGYRFYSEGQLAGARLVALLRRLGMPLPAIADIAGKPPAEAAEAVAGYWAGIERATAGRRVLASYIQATLTGADMPGFEIQTRAIPERALLSVSRHLHAGEAGAFFGDAFARLRSAAPGREGIAGCPFLVFYGEVSDSSVATSSAAAGGSGRPCSSSSAMTPFCRGAAANRADTCSSVAPGNVRKSSRAQSGVWKTGPARHQVPRHRAGRFSWARRPVPASRMKKPCWQPGAGPAGGQGR
jgi:DNA-binding transcriptional MerR regulator